MNAEAPDDKLTLKLHQIDKLYETLARMATFSNKVHLTLLGLSSVLLALSLGVITAADRFSITGLNLNISILVLLTAGAVIVGFLTITFGASIVQMNTLSRSINYLYSGVGYYDTTLSIAANRILSNPVEATNVLYVVTAPLRYSTITYMASRHEYQSFAYRVANLLALVTYMLVIEVPTVGFPVAAQIAAGYKVSALLEPQGLGWVWYLFVFLALFTLTVFVFTTAILGRRIWQVGY